jgi:hypothetical protein
VIKFVTTIPPAVFILEESMSSLSIFESIIIKARLAFLARKFNIVGIEDSALHGDMLWTSSKSFAQTLLGYSVPHNTYRGAGHKHVQSHASPAALCLNI